MIPGDREVRRPHTHADKIAEFTRLVGRVEPGCTVVVVSPTADGVRVDAVELGVTDIAAHAEALARFAATLPSVREPDP